MTATNSKAAATAAIAAARADSNAGFTAHDVAPIKSHWLPTMVVTQATLGEHTKTAAANAAMLGEMFATRQGVRYERSPARIDANPALEMASEQGEWRGSWIDSAGSSQGKAGLYFAQWRLQPASGGWLLNAEVFAPVSSAPSPGDAAAEAAIRAARLASNAAILAHDGEGVATHWLPGVHVTHSNGDLLSGAAANKAMFNQTFSQHADLSFDRRTASIHLDLSTAGEEVAAELGSWLGTWTEEAGQIGVSRVGSYMAQWRRQAGSDRWLINAEVFALEHAESISLPVSDPMPMATGGSDATQEQLESDKVGLLVKQGAVVDQEASRDGITTDAERLLATGFDRLVADSGIDVRRNFLEPEVRLGYDQSHLTAFLRRMPKGGLLHLHGSAGLDFRDAAEMAVTDRLHCYVTAGASANLLKLAAPFIEYRDRGEEAHPLSTSIAAGMAATAAEHQTTLVHWTELNLSKDAMVEMIYSELIQTVGVKGHAVDGHWPEFTKCWSVLRHIEGELWWDTMLPLMLKQLSENGVSYLECKTVVGPLVRPYSSIAELDANLEATVKRFIAIITAHKLICPDWLGGKLVFVGKHTKQPAVACDVQVVSDRLLVITGIKAEDPDALGECMRRLVPLKQKYPEWIAGIE